MIDPIDDLLAAPLSEPSDEGFSARVMGQIHKQRQRDATLSRLVIALAALPLLFLLPIPKLSAEFSHLLPAIAATGPLSIAAALLLLTLSLETLIRQH